MSYDGLLTLFMTLLHTHMCLFVMWNAITPCPALTSIFFLASTSSLLQTLMHCLLWFCPLASFIVSSPACSLPLTLRLSMDGSTSCLQPSVAGCSDLHGEPGWWRLCASGQAVSLYFHHWEDTGGKDRSWWRCPMAAHFQVLSELPFG